MQTTGWYMAPTPSLVARSGLQNTFEISVTGSGSVPSTELMQSARDVAYGNVVHEDHMFDQ